MAAGRERRAIPGSGVYVYVYVCDIRAVRDFRGVVADYIQGRDAGNTTCPSSARCLNQSY